MVGPDYPADSPRWGAQPINSASELTQGRTVTSGDATTLHGRPWSGDARPQRVDLSTDGGATWRRATDRSGRWQPLTVV